MRRLKAAGQAQRFLSAFGYLTFPSRKTSVQSYCLPSSDEIEIRRMGTGNTRRGLLNAPMTTAIHLAWQTDR
jgi:hypothetical protein